MNPIKNITAGIAKFASGAGRAIFDFFGKIGALGGGLLGKIGGVFGKILAPLGFFLSFKDAFDAWMTTEESSILKQGTNFMQLRLNLDYCILDIHTTGPGQLFQQA